MMIRQAIEDTPGFDPSGQTPAGRGMKRIGDLAIAFALIALTLPLMALVSLILKLESGGPVLISEERRTCTGRRVLVLKFRTTRGPGVGDPNWPRHKQPTPIGRFLHYTRIVDLPQLCNVVRGDMSLIDTSAERPDFFN